MFPLLEGGVCMYNYLEFFYMRYLSPLLTYLFVQSFIYINMNSQIFCTLGYNPVQLYFLLLKLFQLWPVGALSAGCGVPSTYPSHCGYHLFIFLALHQFLGSTDLRNRNLLHSLPGLSGRIKFFFWQELHKILLSFSSFSEM